MEIIPKTNDIHQERLLNEVRQIIDTTKQQVAVSVNSAMTMMYWHIGNRINQEVLGGERAAYGKGILAGLAERLSAQYGSKQFSEKNLNRMRLFAERFPDLQIWTSLMSKLSWTHFLQVISLEDSLHRVFYLTMAADKRWSVRTLKAKIDSILYERTAISRKPELTILKDLGIDCSNPDAVPIVPCSLIYPLRPNEVKTDLDLLANLNSKTIKFYTSTIEIPTL